MPDYAPNYEKNKRKLATCVMAFEKDLPRKPLLNPLATKSLTHYDYDFYSKEAVEGKS